ncbi:MAG: glycosyltransferase [Sulfolobales archaeon]
MAIERRLEDYKGIVDEDELESIRRLAKRVEGARILHVNSTKKGGGVAEMLRSIVPLANSVGLRVRWDVIEGDREFFEVTKTFHNALQGNKGLSLSRAMVEKYLEVNRLNAERLNLDADVVVIHDPQPAALISYKRNANSKWIWRCHIDLSDPNQEFWNFLRGFVSRYDGDIFSHGTYIPRDLTGVKIYISHPSIDPLTDKNKPLTPSEVEDIIRRHDIDPERPIVGQVARFDPWKDHPSVVKVYRRLREKVDGLQLVLLGSFADDDPEGERIYREILREVGGERDIHVINKHDDLLVNAVQRSMVFAFQLSIREGFGLTVSEALWKYTPVIARRAGGIPLQVIDGVTGYLVDTLEEAYERGLQLLRKPWLARILGSNGHQHVKKNFLITRDLRDYLRIHIDLVGI